eukprot:COSAG05_NODE_3591_length_1972_cov_31.591030_1_plen_34_part_10
MFTPSKSHLLSWSGGQNCVLSKDHDLSPALNKPS